jgi:hypothetical protein
LVDELLYPRPLALEKRSGLREPVSNDGLVDERLSKGFALEDVSMAALSATRA